MSDFKAGDRVRAKHDHLFQRDVKDKSTAGSLLFFGINDSGMPAHWFERVPDPHPPKYEVPVKMLEDESLWLTAAMTGDSDCETLPQLILRRLAKRGYVPEPEEKS